MSITSLHLLNKILLKQIPRLIKTQGSIQNVAPLMDLYKGNDWMDYKEPGYTIFANPYYLMKLVMLESSAFMVIDKHPAHGHCFKVLSGKSIDIVTYPQSGGTTDFLLKSLTCSEPTCFIDGHSKEMHCITNDYEENTVLLHVLSSPMS